jgi:hypothetical protein
MQNESSNRVQIRVAKLADAVEIIHVHYAAVHGIASAFYPSDILDVWSRKPDEARYQWMRQMIAAGDEIVLVAEALSGILGFGFLIPKLVKYARSTFIRRQVAGELANESYRHSKRKPWLGAFHAFS